MKLKLPTMLIAIALTFSCYSNDRQYFVKNYKNNKTSDASIQKANPLFTPEQLFSSVTYTNVIISPDGKYLAYCRNETLPNQVQPVGAYDTQPALPNMMSGMAFGTDQNYIYCKWGGYLSTLNPQWSPAPVPPFSIYSSSKGLPQGYTTHLMIRNLQTGVEWEANANLTAPNNLLHSGTIAPYYSHVPNDCFFWVPSSDDGHFLIYEGVDYTQDQDPTDQYRFAGALSIYTYDCDLKVESSPIDISSLTSPFAALYLLLSPPIYNYNVPFLYLVDPYRGDDNVVLLLNFASMGFVPIPPFILGHTDIDDFAFYKYNVKTPGFIPLDAACWNPAWYTDRQWESVFTHTANKTWVQGVLFNQSLTMVGMPVYHNYPNQSYPVPPAPDTTEPIEYLYNTSDLNSDGSISDNHPLATYNETNRFLGGTLRGKVDVLADSVGVPQQMSPASIFGLGVSFRKADRTVVPYDNSGNLYAVIPNGTGATVIARISHTSPYPATIISDPALTHDIYNTPRSLRRIMNPTTKDIDFYPICTIPVTYKVRTPAYQADIDYLQALASPGQFEIYDRDKDDHTWIVIVDNGKYGSAQWYLYNRDQKVATKLFDKDPDFGKLQVSTMEPISYVDSLGNTIEGYITYPNTTQKHNLPLIVYLGGGSDYHVNRGYCDFYGYGYEYAPLVKLFNNLGYAVLNINYLGAAGRGTQFANVASNSYWTDIVSQSIIDGALWAVTQKIADPKRLAIAGNFFGGCLAGLIAETDTQNNFKCAINLRGPVDWLNQVFASYYPGNTLLSRVLNYRITGIYNQDIIWAPSLNYGSEQSPIYYATNTNQAIPVCVFKSNSDLVSISLTRFKASKDRCYNSYLFEETDWDCNFVGETKDNALYFYPQLSKFLSTFLDGRYDIK